MQNTALLISILVFAVITLMGSGLFSLFRYRINQQRLINRIRKDPGESALEEKISDHTNDSRNKSSIAVNILAPLGNLLKPKSDDEINYLRKNLVRAGYRKRNAFILFYGAKALFGMTLPLCLSVFKLFLIITLPSMNFLLLLILFAVCGFYLPNIWLRWMITKRQRKILEGLPDALDLMIVCVEAGMGLDSAIARAAREIKLSNKEVSEELNLVNLELRAGKLRRDALRSLSTRIGIEEVNSLISLLIQTDKFGTSVAQALRVHSEAMRDKRFQRADELAAKLPVKLVIPLIFFIFPSIFVVLAGPAIIRIARNLFPLLGGA